MLPEDELEQEDAAPPEPEPEPEDYSALIRDFECAHTDMPEAVEHTLDNLNEWREYVHTTAMLRDEQDAVGTNFILRTQYALMGILVPESPAPVFRPRRQLAAPDMQGLPFQYEDALSRYAQTQEILIDYQQKQGGFSDMLHGLTQDALTCNIAWLKASYQEDLGRDPLGYGRQNDQLDTMARYEFLQQRMLANEVVLSDAEKQEMTHLRPVVQAAAMALLIDDIERTPPTEDTMTIDPETGNGIPGGADPRMAALADLESLSEGEVLVLPEISRFRGWTFQQVRPEDMRWDWNITRPEDLRYARWMSHRSYMCADDILMKWRLEPDDLRGAVSYNSDGSKLPARSNTARDGQGHADEDPEIDQAEQRYAVWERWDITSGKVYVWVEGMKTFLDAYVPKATGRRFFPFFPLIFNRVAGKLIGPSDVELQASLQDEINELRTNEREARRSCHPRYIVAAGLLDPAEKVKLETAAPYAVIELKKADDVKAALHELIPNNYDGRLYDISKALMDMQAMAGLPLSALGATGVGDLATEQAIARENMGIQTDYRKRLIERLCSEVFEFMAQVNAQVQTELEVALVVGIGAVWPLADRQQILNNFIVDVRATLNDSVERQKRLNDWQTVAGIAGQMGLPLNPVEITKEILELLQIRTNLERFVLDPATLQALRGQGAGGGQQQGGGGPQDAPAEQGDRGAEGGAPPMEERGAPSPENIPNGPAAGGA